MKRFSVLSLAAAMAVSLGGPAFAMCSDNHASAPQQTVMVDTKTQTQPPTVPAGGKK